MRFILGHPSRKAVVTGAVVSVCETLGDNAMADILEDDRLPQDPTLTDRRRPGRVDFENARLIALLRGRSLIIDTAKADVDAAPKALPAVDDLAPSRGIAIGVSIGAAMWAAIIFAVSYHS
jgi:hypothetical protein